MKRTNAKVEPSVSKKTKLAIAAITPSNSVTNSNDNVSNVTNPSPFAEPIVLSSDDEEDLNARKALLAKSLRRPSMTQQKIATDASKNQISQDAKDGKQNAAIIEGNLDSKDNAITSQHHYTNSTVTETGTKTEKDALSSSATSDSHSAGIIKSIRFFFGGKNDKQAKAGEAASTKENVTVDHVLTNSIPCTDSPDNTTALSDASFLSEDEVDEIESDQDEEDISTKKENIPEQQTATTTNDDVDSTVAMVAQKQTKSCETPKRPLSLIQQVFIKKHPVRQSRKNVATYNDIANSIDLSLDDDNLPVNKVHRIPRAASSPRSPSNPVKAIPLVAPPVTSTKRRSLKTGFVYDTVMSYHATPDPMEIHPEDPRRIFKIFNMLDRHGLLKECQRIPSRRATKEEILLVHNIVHYRKLRDTSNLKSRAEYMAMENDYDSIYLNSNSFESALYAVGSLIQLLEALVNNKIKNAFAIIRPPGHHAEMDVPMGFCLFNNVAIATKDAMKRLGVKKILIVDWDIHFGNGTQSVFANDPNVLYISLHRFEDGSFYPSDRKGSAQYTGYGKGLGRTVNIPWPCAGMTDADYLYAFRQVVIPIGLEFDPDLVIISAGFDAAINDPIGQCNVTPAGYGQMTHMLKSIANGALLIALEGGYDLNSIAVSALACMNVLLGESPQPIQHNLLPKKECIATINEVKSVHKRYWKSIA